MSRIVLGASASVAVYKACDLASKLTQAGHEVRALLTPRAAQLVSPQLFEAVTGERAYVDEFAPPGGAASGEHGLAHAPGRESAMDHISLAKWAELLVVAPASADICARLALGLGGDLLTTFALALPAARPRLLCPAMNPDMLAQPVVGRHLEQLMADGWRVLSPGSGHLACGDEGAGRLPEPAEIVRSVGELLR